MYLENQDIEWKQQTSGSYRPHHVSSSGFLSSVMNEDHFPYIFWRRTFMDLPISVAFLVFTPFESCGRKSEAE